MTPVDGGPDRQEAEAALATLRVWAAGATQREIDALDPSLAGLLAGDPAALSTDYPGDFAAGDNYRATLPDLQNGPSSLIRGTARGIQHVGISNFRLPISYRTRAGRDLTLETVVTGSVSLAANRKGINMSRIMRSFYKPRRTPPSASR